MFTRLAAEVTRDVDEFLEWQSQQQGVWAGAQFFNTRIRRNIRLAEAPSFGQSIFDYSPNSNGAEDYQQLAREFLGIDVVSAEESSTEFARAA